jgi:pimeloyl-ACP methyl ester carboxylesterase
MSATTLPPQPAKHFMPAGAHRWCYVEGGRPELPPAIIIHGWIASHQLYRRVFQELGELFHFYCVDLLGFGDSDKPDPESAAYDPAWYAQRLAELADALGLKDKKFTLIAQSMGGMAGVELAARWPERLERLVLIDSAGIEVPPPILGRLLQAPVIGKPLFMALGGTRKAITDFLTKDVWYVKDHFDGSAVTEVLRVQALPGGKAAAYATMTRMVSPTAVRAFSPRFADVKVPTGIVWGEHDKLFPLELCGRAIEKKIPGAKLCVVKGSGHEPPVEVPAGFIAALKEAIA